MSKEVVEWETVVKYTAFLRPHHCYLPERKIILEWDPHEVEQYRFCDCSQEMRRAKEVYRLLQARKRIFQTNIQDASMCSGHIMRYDRIRLDSVVNHIRERASLNNTLRDLLVNF